MRTRPPARVTGALAGTAVVVLTAVVLLAARQPPPPVARPEPVALPTASTGRVGSGATGAGAGTEVPWWLLLLALAVLAVGVALVWFVARHGLLGGDAEPPPEPGREEPGPGRARGSLTPLADRAVTDALGTLDRGGDPREVVVACWVRIETAAEAVGLGRRPAETASDVARRWLAASPDRAAVDDLAALYHLARYSSHPLTEAHRDRARTALRGALAGTGAVRS